MACCLKIIMCQVGFLANTSDDVSNSQRSMFFKEPPSWKDGSLAHDTLKAPGILQSRNSRHSLSCYLSTASLVLPLILILNIYRCECAKQYMNTVGWVHFGDAVWSCHHPSTNLRCLVNLVTSKFFVRKSAGCSFVSIRCRVMSPFST